MKLWVRERSELQIFNELVKSLVNTADFDKLLNEIVCAVGKTFRMAHCVLYVWDRKEKVLVQSVSYSDERFQKHSEAIFPIKLRSNEGIMGTITRSRGAQVIDNTAKTLQFISDFEEDRSALVVPIFSQDEMIAVVAGEHFDAEAFSDSDVDILTLFADLAAPTLVNAKLLQLGKNSTYCKDTDREFQILKQTSKNMIAMVSHELRTPLTAIQGFAGFLRDGDAGPMLREQREILDIIIRNGQRLSSLVDTFLDLEKIESGLFRMNKRHFLLETVLKKVGRVFHDDLQHKQVKLKLDLERSLLVFGDEQQLLRVFVNLISNALKFSDAGTIILRAQKNREKIIVDVIDDGEGIPTEDLPHIFERFYQCHHERLGKPSKGNGLGLTLAKVIVLEHGGMIQAKSKPGKGSTILVELPLALDRRTD